MQLPIVAKVLLLAAITSSALAQQWLPLDGPLQLGRGVAFDSARRLGLVTGASRHGTIESERTRTLGLRLTLGD